MLLLLNNAAVNLHWTIGQLDNWTLAMDLMEVWLLWHQSFWRENAFGYWMLQISKWYLLWRVLWVPITSKHRLTISSDPLVVDESIHSAIFAEKLSGEVYKIILHELGACSWSEMAFECSTSRQFSASIWTDHMFGNNSRFQVIFASFLQKKSIEIAKIGQPMSYARKKALVGSFVHFASGPQTHDYFIFSLNSSLSYTSKS